MAETRLYREGLARYLNEVEGFSVVGTSADVPNARNLIRGLAQHPKVVVLDHAIPGGADAVRELCELSPGLRVLAVAVQEAEGEVISWAEAGAAGFISRDASLADLVAGVSAVVDGRGTCSPEVAAVLIKRVAALAETRRPALALSHLTRREREIALLVEEGLSNKEIAVRLTIHIATVKNHVHSILEKLEVRRRGEAASVIRAGATDLVLRQRTLAL